MADLITLEDFKEMEGIENVKDNVRLQSIITSVSKLVKTYCGNSFIDYYSSPYTELFNVESNQTFVQLTESPVVSITSVEERSSYSASYTTLTTGAYEYYLDSDTDVIYRTSSSGYSYFPTGPGAVRVVYTAGYESCPEDLTLAVIDLINYYWKDEYKARRTIGGSSMENTPTSTQWRNVDFPDHIKRILDLYRQQLT